MSGVARDRFGAPVTGAVATLLDPVGRQVGRAFSGGDGHFHIPITGVVGHGVLVVGHSLHRPLTRRIDLADRTHLELSLAGRPPVASTVG